MSEQLNSPSGPLLLAVLNAIADPIFLKDRDGRYLLHNKAHAERRGMRWGDAVGHTTEEVVGAKEMAMLYKETDQIVFETGRPTLNYEEPYVAPDGSRGWLLTSKFPLFGDKGEVVGLIGISRDITHTKEAAEELAKTRDYLARHIENSPLAVVEWGSDLRITRWSGRAEFIFGWSSREAIGKTSEQLVMVPSDDIERVKRVRDAFFVEGNDTFISRNSNLTRDGRLIYCIWHNTALRDASGNIVSILSLVEDITERTLAEKALTEERLMLRNILDAIPDTIFLKDRLGRHTFHNQATETLFQNSGSELIGNRPSQTRIPCEIAKIYEADDQHVLSTGDSVINREEPFIRHDGSPGWLLTSKHPLRDAEGEITGLVGVSRDITELKKSNDELLTTRALLADHVENSPLAVIEWDAQFRVMRWTGQAAEIFGWTTEEVVGRNFNDWAFVHPEDAPGVAIIAQRLIDGTDQRNMSANRNLRKDGTIAHCIWHNSIARDNHGKVASVLSFIEDVSEQVHAREAAYKAEQERHAVQQKLLEAQKLESLGVLASGIAHDFNNLLTTMLGNANLARIEAANNPSLKPLFDDIETAALRAADLCHQMLAYAGKGRLETGVTALNDLIRETAELLKVSTSKRVVLTLSPAKNLPLIHADATQIRQVIMNLVINASEAIGDRDGWISISTGMERPRREACTNFRVIPDDFERDYVWLEIRDNGCGMTPDILTRIFDPFFTTKFTGRGLGLAAVAGIIRSHQGGLDVQSIVGTGTVFRILLPVATNPATGSAVHSADENWRGHGTILVVDDEAQVRTLAKRMLESIGFQVVLADDGREGLNAFASQPSRFRAVLLDLTMPQLDGGQTLDAMRTIDPDIPVLLMSGYSEQELSVEFTARGIGGVLQKPFRLPSLREKIRILLENSTHVDRLA